MDSALELQHCYDRAYSNLSRQHAAMLFANAMYPLYLVSTKTVYVYFKQCICHALVLCVRLKLQNSSAGSTPVWSSPTRLLCQALSPNPNIPSEMLHQ